MRKFLLISASVLLTCGLPPSQVDGGGGAGGGDAGGGGGGAGGGGGGAGGGGAGGGGGGGGADGGWGCDPALQDCPSSVLACYLPVGSPPACLPPGIGSEGAPCQKVNDCSIGYSCGPGGVCHRLCNTDGGQPACGLNQLCTVLGSGYYGYHCSDPGSLRACGLATALDRIVIVRSQPAERRCTAVRLVSPGGPSAGVQLPAGWGVEGASTGLRDGGCTATTPLSDPAGSISGVIAFDGGSNLPTTLERVAVNLSFPLDGGAWIYLGARDLPIASCP